MLEIDTAKVADIKELTHNEYLDSSVQDKIKRKELQYYLIGKRLFDIVASCLALILLFPFMLIVCLIVFIDDPSGSPIFKQIRCGKDGKLFTMYKFRSMCVNAEDLLNQLKNNNEMDGPAFKIKNDPRVTKIGKILRASCVDELPQLFNILQGDMSIVGPRPPLPNEVDKYSESEKQRLSVVPGLTCYWQIQPNRNSISFDEWMKLDKQYIKERSFSVDFEIIVKTFSVVMHMKGC